MARKKTENKSSPKLYTYEQLQKVEDHIEKYYGTIENYFQETETDDIRLNIYVIPPNLKKRCWTLVTGGMGAFEMNVPESIREKKLSRCEFVISLPPNWNIHGDELEDCWPLHLLKLLSRLPIKENNWLGWGHSVDYGTNFAPNTQFSSIFLISPFDETEPCICKLPDGDEVNFYQIIPLYHSELEFKNKNGTSALLDQFGSDFSRVIDIERPAVVEEDFMNVIDTVESHSRKIAEKSLDIPSICSANHIAAYLRWIIEHNMLSEDFVEFFEEEIQAIRDGKLDIRKFIINSLSGEFLLDMLNDEGSKFTLYYYNFYCDDEDPCFPEDVDNVAMDYFGEEKYNCREFGDEAYLFVPYNEDYYKAMCGYIDKNYDEFKKYTLNIEQ